MGGGGASPPLQVGWATCPLAALGHRPHSARPSFLHAQVNASQDHAARADTLPASAPSALWLLPARGSGEGKAVWP